MDRVLPSAPADVIDLADVVRSVRHRWMTIVGCTLAGLAAAALLLIVIPPRFDGAASIVLKTGEGSSLGSSLASAIGSLAETGGAAGGGSSGGALASLKSGNETEMEILKSRTLVGQVATSQLLQAQIVHPRPVPPLSVFSSLDVPGAFKKRVYEFAPESLATGVRYRFSSDGDQGIAVPGQPTRLAIGTVVLALSVPRHEFKVVFRDHDDATSRMVDHIDFAKSKGDIAHLQYRGDDSVSAARVPNEILSLYLARRRTIDRGVNQRTAEFLEEKLDSVGKALVVAERSLRRQREETGTVDPLKIGVTEYENENKLRQQVTDLRTQERMLQQLMAQIREGSATPIQLASYPQYLGSGPIINIVNSLVAVETERQALLGTVTAEDERVKSLATRARELEGRLMPLAQTTLQTLGTQRAAAEQQLQSVEQSLAGLPKAAESYGRLERDVMDLGQIFAGLQIKLVDARLAAITEGGDVRQLDTAVTPKKPAFPKTGTTLASGFGSGLFFGTALAVLLGIAGGRMEDARDVERRTGLPAVRLDAASPLLIAGAVRSVIVAPVNGRAQALPVAQRLVETALSRSMSATLLDLSADRDTNRPVPGTLVTQDAATMQFDANAAILRLEENHDFVVVLLPTLQSRSAGAVLGPGRPVLLVAPERRIDRGTLQDAVDVLRRVGASCAGVVLNGDDRRTIRA